MPWQETAATYATALGPEGRWLYREFAAVVARQNGKTTFTRPLIVRRLLTGRRVMHIAQVRELPRIMFEAIADVVEQTNPDLLPRRRGKVIYARRGAGSESIVLTNGGEYRIASAITGGRGFSFDDLLIDELLAMESFDVINAAKPAQRFAENPQTIYLSNMGTDASVILNSLRVRAGVEPPEGSTEPGEPDASLAYLEWSAAPDLADDDLTGWLQANPSVGPENPQVLRDLEQEHHAAKLAGNMAGFETEALCRKVPTMRPRLVDDFAWARCKDLHDPHPKRPAIGIGYDAGARRASIVAAWRESERTHLTELFDVEVADTAIAALGADAMRRVHRMGAAAIGYDDATDRDLARQFTGPLAKRTKPLIGKDFANASEAFVRAVESDLLRWHDGDHVALDLRSTSRHENSEAGTYHAVKSRDEIPITASLAAIRAYWLASATPPTASPRVY